MLSSTDSRLRRQSSLVDVLMRSSSQIDAQLNTFMGVFLPCICTIFGVVIYLRMGFLVGQAGLFGSFLILGAAFFISFLTVLSLSALVSSGEVRSGGLYDGVRKSVGPEFGAVIGILFFCAYVVGIANYAIGFAHALVSQAGIHESFNIFPWNPPGSWVETIVASLVTLLAAIVASKGVAVGSRVLLFIFIIIIISIVTSMLCLLISTTDHQSGHTAFSFVTLQNNTGWDLTPFGPYQKNSPWLMFTLLFPGFTGVIAGANLSGELKTPRESIAIGTLSALLFAFATYAFMCFVLASTVNRVTLKKDMLIIDTVVDGTTSLPIVFVGIMSTTLSSVLSYMLGAPRILQAMARDNLFPILKPFAATSSNNNEPVRAILFTWVLTQIIILIGDLNLLLPIVSGCFLICFCAVNLTCFILEFSPNHDSHERHFQLYSKWSALLGFVLSLAATFLNSISGIVAAILTVFISLIVWNRRVQLAATISKNELSNESNDRAQDSMLVEVKEDSERALFKERSGSLSVVPEHMTNSQSSTLHRKSIGPTTYIDLASADPDWNDDDGSGAKIDQSSTKTRSRQSENSEDGDLSSTLIQPLLETKNDSIDNNHNKNKYKNKNNSNRSETQWDQDEHLVRLASSYVRDALKGRYNRFAPWAVDVVVANSRQSDVQYRLSLHRALHNMRFIRTFNLITFLSLSFFEQPIWCSSNYHHCDMAQNSHMKFFGLPVLPSSITLTVEFICVVLFALEMFAKAKILGRAQFFRNRWYMIQIVLLTADLTGVGVMILAPDSLPLWNPIIRPIVFVALSQSMRGALATLLRTLPSVLDSVVLITLLLVIYSTVGLLLFRNTEEGLQYFPNFSEAMVNMLVLLTTANYPDVMMPAYNASRPSVLFFISFLLVGLFFCMNLVLASVYNNYKIQMTERAVQYHRLRRYGLTAAFKKLDTNNSGYVRIASCARLLGELSRPSISMFNWEMSRYTSTKSTQIMLQSWWDKVIDERLAPMEEPPTPPAPSTPATTTAATTETTTATKARASSLLFYSTATMKPMERPMDDLIPLEAFCDMMISVEQAKDLHKRNLSSRRRFPNGIFYIKNNRMCIQIKYGMNHYLWDWGVGLLVVINTLIIIVEADIDASLPNGTVTNRGLLLCEYLNMFFGFVYVIEMMLKILILGQQKYWSRLQHRFDTFTTSLVVVGQVLQIVMKAHNVPLSDVTQYILILRLTRTLRLVVVVRRFNEIFNIFIDLLPAFSTLFGMMWTVFSVYASVGMVLFGGKITTNSTILMNSTYGQANYYSNNFNDFASSLVTLFEVRK